MSDPKSKLAEAKSEYIALAKEFSKKVNKAMLALTKHNDVQLPFDLESRRWSNEVKAIFVGKIVGFLENLTAGEKIADFFYFDIEAKTKSNPPQLIKDSTIEVTMPQNLITTRTRIESNPEAQASSDDYRDQWLASQKPAYINVPLKHKTITQVLRQVQEDLRKQVAQTPDDETLATIAACIDVIKEELDRTSLPEVATDYLYLKRKEKEAASPKPNDTISPAEKAEAAIAAAKAKLA